MCLLSPCSCSKCLVIIGSFFECWRSPCLAFDVENSAGSPGMLEWNPRVGGVGGWGSYNRGTYEDWAFPVWYSDIYRNECILFTIFCFSPVLVSEVQYLLSNIAQLTYVRAQLWAQMLLLPDDGVEWKQDIKLLIFLYYFCLRNMDLDIHFWNAFKVSLIKSNLKMEILFYFVQLGS